MRTNAFFLWLCFGFVNVQLESHTRNECHIVHFIQSNEIGVNITKARAAKKALFSSQAYKRIINDFVERRVKFKPSLN